MWTGGEKGNQRTCLRPREGDRESEEEGIVAVAAHDEEWIRKKRKEEQ